MAGTAVTEEQAVERYRGLIWAQVGTCLRKLPPGSAFEPEDLFQEGAERAVHAARAYDPARGNEFSTYLTFAVVNRFGGIVKREWERFHKVKALDGVEHVIDATGSSAPGQDGVDCMLDVDEMFPFLWAETEDVREFDFWRDVYVRLAEGPRKVSIPVRTDRLRGVSRR